MFCVNEDPENDILNVLFWQCRPSIVWKPQNEILDCVVVRVDLARVVCVSKRLPGNVLTLCRSIDLPYQFRFLTKLSFLKTLQKYNPCHLTF